ncbi:head GIN domain-containing protein [Moheibacter sediminis]|uniref:Putative auto-transporter adhesin, head GIN domain n=1 Tax=Moheibacter sediminis TaxID=1434700 RepID=A0A1W1Y5Z5_9FLAO|nr:head GIN domain-containing protein [Moheibacter sediminis]SMC31630.1 Putative auto-transporter adhesin, head GIN domain [Moheibacter sediminis]
MKGIGFLFLIIFCFSGCNSEEGSDCFKKQGEQITEVISVENFSKIHISKGVELIIKESDQQKVTVTAGKNLISNVTFEVINGELFVKDNSGCHMFRNVSIAKVYVSTPVLEKIYSASQFSIHSEGMLHFPDLTLESGTLSEDVPSSVFDLEINNQNLTIHENVSSVFKIKGNTENLNVNFWGSNGRLEAQNLIAKKINVFHRSTNDMIVYPTEKISGTLYSTGNLVLKNFPPIVNVEQLYTGQVVYP